MSTPGFAVIGAGTIGQIHLDALRAAGLAVAAVADLSAAALERAASLAPAARLTEDWRQAVADPDVQAVVICTVTSAHVEILREALAAGKHVLCEKTLAPDAGEARRAAALPMGEGQVARLGYMKRHFPASLRAKEWMSEIGEPLCASVRTFQGGVSEGDIFNSDNWRPAGGVPSLIRRFASGGMLTMAGSHMLDLTHWLLGPPEEITCRTWAPPGYDVELHAHGLFKMRAGALVHFEACLPPFTKTGEFGNGWEEVVRIDGTLGRIELIYPVWNRPAEHAAIARLYLESRGAWHEDVFPRVNAFQSQIESFAAATGGRSDHSATLADGALVDLWIADCYRSAADGAKVVFEG
jgi:predicted dehydrogenase